MAGRKKKYCTEEEIRKANRIKAERYYWKNCELIKEKNKKRYHNKIKNK